MTEIQNCTLQFDEKTVSSNFVFVLKYARLKEEALGLTVQYTYIQDGSIGEASAADISYYYYYILLTCIITQPILAHPPIKLPTQLGPLPLLITEKNIPHRINKTKTLIHS